MSKEPKTPWFSAKRYGYGSGLPIAWQGWVVLGVYLSTVILASLALSPLLAMFVLVISTPVLLVVCARRTAGGWRWRNGDQR